MTAKAPFPMGEFRPIPAGTWIHAEDGMVCRLPLKRLRVIAPPAFLQAVASRCDGSTGWQSLRGELVRQWPARQVDAALTTLLKEGALVDGASVLATQAQIGWTPQPLPSPLTSAQALNELRRATDEPLIRAVPEAMKLRPGSTPLAAMLRGRASARTFDDRPLSLQSVVNILWSIYGVSGKCEDRMRRTVPSGGALYGLRWLVALMRPLEGFPRGLYEVCHHASGCDAGAISLRPLDGEADGAWSTLLKPAVLSFAQAVIYPVANLPFISRKYGNRSITLAMLEAGHALQNGSLAAQHEGASTIVRGDTVEQEVLSLFGLENELYPLPSMVLGAKPTPSQELLASTVERFAALSAVPNHSTRLPMRTRVAVAGPVAMGSARAGATWAMWAAGRSNNPRLAVIKAEAEAWERIGWSTPRADMQRARFGELDNALDPRALVTYSQKQYARADFPYAAFSTRRLYAWTSASRARDGATIPVLAQCVYALSSLSARDARSPYTNASTSGVAAYTDIETARTRALVELIERDAFARMWLAKRPPGRLDESRCAAPLRQRLAALREAGYEAVPLVLASRHLPVGAIFVQSSTRSFTSVTTAAGFGWDEALDSALSEAESRVQQHHGEPDHPPMGPAEVTLAGNHGDFYRTLKGHKLADWLRSSSAPVDSDEPRFAADGNSLMSHFADLKAEVYFCDLTPPLSSIDQGRRPLHVVRAFVPGLVPIWFGHGVEPAGMACSAGKNRDGKAGWPARVPVPIHPCT